MTESASPRRPKPRISRWLRVLVLALVAGLLLLLVIDQWIEHRGGRQIKEQSGLKPASCIIVPGARVYADGRPSPMLQDRLDGAIQLYRAGLAPRILLSGDHGKKEYNEVKGMRDYLLRHDIPGEHIFLDHAGFDTYATIVRAQKVFAVKEAIIVTQRFHLIRALYIAEATGLQATGFAADTRHYAETTYLRLREVPARLKCFIETTLKPDPKFLGEVLSIEGDGRTTWDDLPDS